MICFSALQRAENFSIWNRLVSDPLPDVSVLFSEPKISQSVWEQARRVLRARFSALQRAENFSIAAGSVRDCQRSRVSVLFSEPKISQ